MATQVAEKTHAKLGPSGWDWWSRCSGAPTLVEASGVGSKTSIYAAEGSVAHEIADKVLSGEIENAEDVVGQVFSCDGFDFVVDMEMADHVNDYVEYVRDRAGEDGILMPEQLVPIGHLTGEEGAEGTSDTIIIANGGRKMIVIDFKYGRGVAVSAEGNGQGRMYALGALEKFGFIYDEIEEVETVIFQPRVDDGISSETLTIAELEDFRAEVEMAAGRVELARTQDYLDFLNPGEKQCKFCDAKAICPALKAEVSTALATVASDPSDFDDLTVPKQASRVEVSEETPGEKLAEFARAIPLIEQAIKGVQAEIERRLLAGKEVPGFYLGVGKAGNRKWQNEVLAEKELKSRLKVEQAYTRKLISPTQAEKLFKDKPRVWAKIVQAAGIDQSEGKPSVCREGKDKNPPYVLSSPESFPDLSEEDAKVQALVD